MQFKKKVMVMGNLKMEIKYENIQAKCFFRFHFKNFKNI